MYGELGIEDGSGPLYVPPLAHERMGSMFPGLSDLCRTTAVHLRREPGFDDRSTIMTAEQIRTNLEIQRSDNPPPFHGSRPLASRGSRVARPADAVDRTLLERTGYRRCD